MRKAIGSFGDVNPIEHGGAVVFTNEYGPAFFAFRMEGEVVIVSCVHIEDDAMADLDWADWASIAQYRDQDLEEMRQEAKSENPVARAQMYAAVGDYHGYLLLDESPQYLTVEQAEAQFADLFDGAP